MPAFLTLSVPEPCPASWDQMTPATQGRHCAACNKVVLDFTQKTDAEILALLQRAAAPCGRFRPDQLGRPLLPPPAVAPRWRTWLAAAATVLGLRETAAEASRGQQVPTAEVFQAKDVRKAEALQRVLPQVTDTTRNVLRGRVVDQATGVGLPGATVLLKGTTIGTSTDSDGTFELHLTAEQSGPVTLSIHSIGFISREAAANPGILLNLSLDNDVKGQLERWYAPRSLWWRLTQPFRR